MKILEFNDLAVTARNQGITINLKSANNSYNLQQVRENVQIHVTVTRETE